MTLNLDDLNQRLLCPTLGVMNLLNELAERYPQAISFAAGRPFGGFFRAREALTRIEEFSSKRSPSLSASDSLDVLVQYGYTNGIIQDDLARHLSKDEKIEVSPGSIIVTVGCQEAMMICLVGLCHPGRDVLFVSDPAYIGVAGIAKLLGIELCPVRSTESGLDLEDLRSKLVDVRARGLNPKLVYDIPDFSNPSGASMPLENRHQLLEMAEAHGFLILEDSAYRSFYYDKEPPLSLKALDRSRTVIFLGTFAKTIFPGVRLGYLVADQHVTVSNDGTLPLTEYLSKVKSLVSVNTPPINQALVTGILRAEGDSLRNYIAPQVSFYRKNRDHLLECLEWAFPSGEDWARQIRWNRPEGGFFLTLTLPIEVDDEVLERSAREYGVIWVPMRHFHYGPGGQTQMRLSFSYLSREEISEGVTRLSRLVRDLVNKESFE